MVRGLAQRCPALQQYEVSLVMAPGTSLKVDLRESVCFPLWKYGCYPHQLAEDRLAFQFIRPGDSVWDVGANIGYTAILYSLCVRESGFVLAFEPSPKAFHHLARNVRGYTNIVPLQFAVSDREDDLYFEEKHALDTSALVSDAIGDERAMKVRGITLDSLLSTYRPPDFLKIDVEGHEAQALNGAADLIRRFHPLIQFEALSETSLHHILEVFAAIAGRDYSFHQISRAGRLSSALDTRRTDCTHNFLAATASHCERLESKR